MYNKRETFDWWNAKKPSDLYENVHGFLHYLDQNQGHRSIRNMRNVRLYGNFDPSHLHAYNYTRKEQSGNNTHRVTLNIVRSMVDTVVSKITKNKPVPTFLTSGGQWSDQRKAKKLSKFVEGQFYACKLYEKRAQTFKDSCIFGTGVLKIYKQDGEIKAERVYPDEIIVDDMEGFYGNPRQMHQTKFIHKDTLIAKYPEHKGSIEVVNESVSGYKTLKPRHSDLVLVVESWKRPSKPGADDGRHSITIENELLFDEVYTKDYFPFVFDRWNITPFGFYGQGLADQLDGLQLEINKILRTIQVSMHLVSIPKVFVEAGSKIVDSHLDNKIGGIIKYAGAPPTPGQLGSIPRELFSHLDYLYNRGYEITGISQLSAQSTKPVGLNSGKALRIYNDLESERFLEVATRYEQAYLQAASIMIDLAKELDMELEGGYKVLTQGKKSAAEIKWSDVDLEEDQYMMKMHATSALSNSPAGRLEEVQELMAAGFIDIDMARKLIDFPDLENYYDMSTAAINDIERQIEMIIDDGKYQTPEPFQDLQGGIARFQSAYLYYKSEGAPEKTLEMLRRWITDANDLLTQTQEALAPPPPVVDPALNPGVPQVENELPADPLAIADPTALPVDPNQSQ